MPNWIRTIVGSTLAVVAGSLAYGRYLTPSRLPLPKAVAAERRMVRHRAGDLSYYVTGEGSPILLIHSINAAASVYEIAPIFEAFRNDRRVYAVDLPGFGFSERTARRYDIDLYVDAIADMLDVIASETGRRSVDILAVSLSAEFLARLASERPGGLRTLCLVTPTGFDRVSSGRRGREGSNREVPGLHATVTFPLWSRALYNLLVTRPSIRFFLEKTWGSKRIDEGAFEYSYRTSHQPGAERAPFAFVSGRLFSGDIRSVYERLNLPVLVIHGTRGDFGDFTGVGWTRSRPNWTVVPLPTGALPHFERPAEFAAIYRDFLDRGVRAPDQASSSPSRSPRP